ncbi:alpha/beta hydrolase [Aquabacterium sp. OR-4]|uniref:alpha/beta hydrolase n=1 Tax=Aquabacterium sp. OR-4 TaxID=2978127 RepID=UPI0021B32FC0|nr:alpha/beta hydrolase [Aquabacterium sp. OR-4]MDT7834621.1 alpha/beta hydrolase [Aquabacterium sp. OR-4]
MRHKHALRAGPAPGRWPGAEPWQTPALASAALIHAPIHAPIDALSDLLDAVAAGDGASREGLVAVLNGLLGDHLQRAEHALATPMQWRHQAAALDLAAPGLQARPRVLLMVHDLCLNEAGWQREGHEHGPLLARHLGATLLHLRYNSGLSVAANGARLNHMLEALAHDWPVSLQALDIVGHGMGGLVARSACAQAAVGGARWPARLRRLVFLGTPQLGLPLERMGSWLRRVLGLRSASAPLARLAGWRSAGMADLRHGDLLPPGGQGGRGRGQPPQPLRHAQPPLPPLPPGVACHAIAGCLGSRLHSARRGDGLVPLASALGQQPRSALGQQPRSALVPPLPATACWVGEGLHHLDLLSSALVYRRLLYALSDG